ncbi:MAG: hypothetical protein MJ177_09645 [Clostridia bacterium]|nr:hypothetical protein [Clostridia bacterium]
MLTQRLGSSTQKNEKFIDSLIKTIGEHEGCCDEVWFATDYGFPPLEKHRESAQALIKSADKFRKAGIRVSLQLSNSIGHGQYMSVRDCTGLVYDGTPVGKMVDANGTVADYCFCWNDEYFRNYTFSALKYYLEAIQPYRLWVDDDLRAVNHNPVEHGCFCPRCISLFNARYGTDYDRQGLVDAIHNDIEIRKKHIEFVRDSLGDFTYRLGLVVKQTAPDCAMGLQGCANGGYTGFGYDFLLDEMLRATEKAPAFRAGGGAYNDYSPSGFINKSTFLAYQHFMLPDYVTDKRPEIENLPDVVFGKSIPGTCFETTCYLAYGSTAMSYAMLMNDYEPMSWHGEMLSAFSSHRKYWKRLSENSKRSTLSGLTPFYPKTAFLKKSSHPFDYSQEDIFFVEPLRYCAVPVGITKKEADIYVINGKNAAAMSDEEVMFLLSKPVICDGEAVYILNSRGFLPDISAKEIPVQRLRELFSSHSINRGMENRTWGGQIWRNSDWLLSGSDTEIISEYICQSSGQTEKQGVASCVFTTPAGARWAAFGFDMWERTKSTEKRAQLLNAAEYISGKRFTAEITNPVQSCVIPTVNEYGKCTAVSVINCTVGKTAPQLIIRNPEKEKFVFMSLTPDSETPLKAEKINENEYTVNLPEIDGWSVGTVFC